MNKSAFLLMSDLLLNKGDENFLSVKRVRLLENIIVYGSIAKAAKASGVTYKTAWEWMDKMNALSPKPLVQKVSGGKGGGGTVVTAYAKELMHLFEEVEALHQKHLHVLEESFSHLESEEAGSFSFSRLEGKIIEISFNAKNAIVSVVLSNGSVINAQAPVSFVEVNALKVGSAIMALIESDAISVSRSFDKEISSRNKLKTEVKGISIEEEDVLLTLGLDEVQLMTSRITLKSFQDLEIRKGDILMAMFKAYSVTLFNAER